jgi:hypothetical protein
MLEMERGHARKAKQLMLTSRYGGHLLASFDLCQSLKMYRDGLLLHPCCDQNRRDSESHFGFFDGTGKSSGSLAAIFSARRNREGKLTLPDPCCNQS